MLHWSCPTPLHPCSLSTVTSPFWNQLFPSLDGAVHLSLTCPSFWIYSLIMEPIFHKPQDLSNSEMQRDWEEHKTLMKKNVLSSQKVSYYLPKNTEIDGLGTFIFACNRIRDWRQNTCTLKSSVRQGLLEYEKYRLIRVEEQSCRVSRMVTTSMWCKHLFMYSGLK